MDQAAHVPARLILRRRGGAQKNADDSIQYCHSDLVGSTVATTDADGTNGVFDGPAITVAYTAFGELVANDGSDNISIGLAAPAGFPRYQYCGAWGYETSGADGSGAMLSLSGHDTSLPPIRLSHVGARWYDPALGRFVQRDRIGLCGALNLYGYAHNNSVTWFDVDGLGPDSVTSSAEKAIASGNVEEVKCILESSGDMMNSALRKQLQDWLARAMSRAQGQVGISDKIARQMTARGWTEQRIANAVKYGQRIQATNKATGNAAIRYVHPETGQSVVVDTVTNDVIHVGGPGFRYGPPSGDLP